MLLAIPITEPEATVRPVWLDTVVAKLAAVDTINVYDAAPVTVPHVNVGEVGSFTVPLVGVASTGIAGVAIIVVKFHAPDQALIPPTFVALTSQ